MKHQKNFLQINYLATGTPRQQAAHAVLTKHAVLETLRDFNPVLAGTLPIQIDIESSDLDIICQYDLPAEFCQVVHQAFEQFPGFFCHEANIGHHVSIIAGCRIDGFELEFFAQPIPVTQQNAYRHMLIEYEVLSRQDSSFREQIIALKRNGYKTEPAFALLLGLDLNDPYQALLDFGQQQFGI